MSAARRTMDTNAIERWTRRSGNRTRSARRSALARIAVAALSSLAAVTAPPAAASDGFGVGEGPPPELQRARSKRWWLDFWCHSMQEQCFVLWMDAATGGTAWRHVMTVPQVNALYAWWLAEVWTGSKG